MSVIVSSTTDTAEAINQAASAGENDEVTSPATGEPAGANRNISTVKVDGRSSVASTSDTPEQVREVAEDLAEHQEEKREAYQGKTRQKLLRRLSRLHSEVEERDQRPADGRRRVHQPRIVAHHGRGQRQQIDGRSQIGAAGKVAHSGQRARNGCRRGLIIGRAE